MWGIVILYHKKIYTACQYWRAFKQNSSSGGFPHPAVYLTLFQLIASFTTTTLISPVVVINTRFAHVYFPFFKFPFYQVFPIKHNITTSSFITNFTIPFYYHYSPLLSLFILLPFPFLHLILYFIYIYTHHFITSLLTLLINHLSFIIYHIIFSITILTSLPFILNFITFHTTYPYIHNISSTLLYFLLFIYHLSYNLLHFTPPLIFSITFLTNLLSSPLYHSSSLHPPILTSLTHHLPFLLAFIKPPSLLPLHFHFHLSFPLLNPPHYSPCISISIYPSLY